MIVGSGGHLTQEIGPILVAILGLRLLLLSGVRIVLTFLRLE